MSIESWKGEFYPVDASDIAKGRATDVELVEHSLNKWKGLLPENLKRHGVSLSTTLSTTFRGIVADNGSQKSFYVDSTSCSLCEKFSDGSEVNPCTKCPLAASRDGVPCDGSREGISPWNYFTMYGDPEPMIASLEKALEYAKEQER